MRLEVALPRKVTAAHATLIGLFFRVPVVMTLQVVVFLQQCATHTAGVIFPSHVVGDVFLKVGLAGKIHLAQTTHEWWAASLAALLLPRCFPALSGNARTALPSACSAGTLGCVAATARHRKQRSTCFFLRQSRMPRLNSTVPRDMNVKGVETRAST